MNLFAITFIMTFMAIASIILSPAPKTKSDSETTQKAS